MDSQQWIATLIFASVVAISYICYAVAFRQAGPMRWDLCYFASVVLHPLFLLGLILAFVAGVTRLVLFHHLGIARTVLVSELAVVLMLVVSLTIFRERLSVTDALGALLIMGGVWLVGR